MWLCAACLAGIAPLRPPLCARCGRPRPASGDDLCAPCRAGELRALDWARAAYPFAGPVRAAIHRFKYKGERARAGHLGALLVPLLAPTPAPTDTRLIPVPLSADRRRERGYNQAEELARVLAATSGLALDVALTRTRATRPQVGLDRAARRRNVDGAFTWAGAPLAGAAVILIDDVLTTGATAAACAEALKGAGAGRVGLLTVARAAERSPEEVA